MLDWLKRRGDRGELPEYAALRAVPTRRLPRDLAEEEAGESFTARREAVGRALLEPSRWPAHDRPLFTELLAVREGGLLTIALPDDGGQCVPVFSTPFRAADYVRVLVARGPALQYLASSPLEFVRMLRDLEGTGIEQFVLDRCPRCTMFTAFESASVRTADDAVTVWSIVKTTELARLHLYLAYARRAAREGRLEVARDVALETVGHVSLEDPRPHLLLGQIAVALGDRRLLNDAKTFLQFFELDAWDRQLDRAIRSGSPDFEDVE